MPMVLKTAQFSKLRILISGFSMSGKTHSLKTFIYGPHDIDDPEEHDEALAYAEQQGKHMVVLTCPGETGSRTLPDASAHITPYYYQVDDPEDISTGEWSRDALSDFFKLEKEVVRNKPDILAYDGLNGLALHQMNDITNGEFLAGVDMATANGNKNPYRVANFYARLANTFGQTMATIYHTPVPIIICTVLEDWSTQQKESDRPKSIDAPRFLIPDIPGKMASKVVSMFDARVSARLENTCIHTKCEERRVRTNHYVWQFAPAGDVVQVGIKGLHVQKGWRSTPFIHQDWYTLKQLIGVKDE